MNEHLANLGTVAVLDATNLVEGSVLEIDVTVLYVSQIINENVYFQPLTGSKLYQYRWNNLSRIGKFLFVASSVCLIGLPIFFIIRLGALT